MHHDIMCVALCRFGTSTEASVPAVLSLFISYFTIAITCPPSTAPTNGSVIYSSTADENGTYALDVVATYNCDNGFSLAGDQARTCTGDGNSTTGAFNGLPPTCECKCILLI